MSSVSATGHDYVGEGGGEGGKSSSQSTLKSLPSFFGALLARCSHSGTASLLVTMNVRIVSNRNADA